MSPGRSSTLPRATWPTASDCTPSSWLPPHTPTPLATRWRPDKQVGPLELAFRRPPGLPHTRMFERSTSLMFKKLPGDETRSLVSTTPDTAVVFRPAVVHTPAIISLILWLCHLVAGLVRLVWRHPLAVAVPVLVGLVSLRYGYLLALVVLGLVLTAGLSWFSLDRASFLHLVGWRLLAFARWFWIYRRHWQPVMTVS